MSFNQRNSAAYLVVLTALVAVACGELAMWQRMVGLAALVVAAVILPKPWREYR